MKYCGQCGNLLASRIPPGDDRLRFVCDTCQTIHYENPKIVVGCIPEFREKILLCRRAIEPCLGRWTLPAGYLENGETLLEAVKREVFEEAKARLTELIPYGLYNLTFVNEVYIMFHGHLLDQDYGPGRESSEVRLLAEADIPWEDLAFSAIRQTLTRFFADRKEGALRFHMGDVQPG